MNLKSILANFLWWASGTQQNKDEYKSKYVKYYGIGAVFTIIFLLSFLFSSLIINEKIEDDFSIRVEKKIPYAIYFSEYKSVENLNIVSDNYLQEFHNKTIKNDEIPDSINDYINEIDKGKDVIISYISETKVSVKKNALIIAILSGFLLSCFIFLALQYLGSIPNKFRQVQRFFWWCGGCEIEILEKHKEEHSKYFGVGGTVLFTALMASLAGGYAFYTAFGSDESTIADKVLSVFFGLFWGSLIFNLDRYIVSTFGVGDGKKSISLQEIISALPRIVIAFVLGLVISTPLEIKIFEKELEVGLEKLINQKKEDLRISNTTFNNDLLNKKNDIIKVETDIKALKNEKQDLEQNGQQAFDRKVENAKEIMENAKTTKNNALPPLNQARNELWTIDNTYKSIKNDSTVSNQYKSQIRNKWLRAIKNRDEYGDRYKAAEKEYLLKKKEYEDLKVQGINGLLNEIDKIKGLITDKQNVLKKLNIDLQEMENNGVSQSKYNDEIANKYRGLMGKLEALSMLTYETKYDTLPISDTTITSVNTPKYEIIETQEKTSIFYAKWLITFLFIFIEIAPILFKMMTESGPYDQEIENIKKIKQDQFSEELSKVRHEINTNMKIAVDNHQNRLDAEILANEKLLTAVAEAQAEIAIEQVNIWKKGELEKYKDDSKA